MVLIYAEARGVSAAVKGFLKGYFPMPEPL
jgi:hypothetical protein